MVKQIQLQLKNINEYKCNSENKLEFKCENGASGNYDGNSLNINYEYSNKKINLTDSFKIENVRLSKDVEKEICNCEGNKKTISFQPEDATEIKLQYTKTENNPEIEILNVAGNLDKIIASMSASDLKSGKIVGNTGTTHYDNDYWQYVGQSGKNLKSTFKIDGKMNDPQYEYNQLEGLEYSTGSEPHDIFFYIV